jgi:hypothetical protein
MGIPARAIAKTRGCEVVLDVAITVSGSGNVYTEIPVPDGIKWNASSGLIHAHLIDQGGSSSIVHEKDGTRLRIRGMIVDEGYNAYTIYVRALPEHLPPVMIFEIGASLKKRLPADWTLTVSNKTIFIRSAKDVWLLGINLPGVTPGETEEQYARENGYKTKYEIKLAFVPRLTDAQLEKIRTERLAIERSGESMPNDKHKLSFVSNGLADHPLPVYYTENYSIFLESPDGFYGVYPPEIAKQVVAINDLFRLKFHKYQEKP